MVLPIAKEIFAEAGKAGGLDIAAWTIFLGANDAGESETSFFPAMSLPRD